MTKYLLSGPLQTVFQPLQTNKQTLAGGFPIEYTKIWSQVSLSQYIKVKFIRVKGLTNHIFL